MAKQRADQLDLTGRGAYDAPADLGFKSWSVNPQFVGSGQVPTAGILLVQRQRLLQAIASGDSIGSQVYVQTAGTGATALANCYVGLYRADTGALIASSATQATAWSTVGVKDAALTASAAKPYGVECYSAVLVGTQSTTALALARVTNVAAAGLSAGRGTPVFASGGTGLTALPGTLPTLTAAPIVYFLGLY